MFKGNYRKTRGPVHRFVHGWDLSACPAPRCNLEPLRVGEGCGSDKAADSWGGAPTRTRCSSTAAHLSPTALLPLPLLCSITMEVGKTPATTVVLANYEPSFWLSGVPAVGAH